MPKAYCHRHGPWFALLSMWQMKTETLQYRFQGFGQKVEALLNDLHEALDKQMQDLQGRETL